MESKPLTSTRARRSRLIGAALLAVAGFLVWATPSLASGSSRTGRVTGPDSLRKAARQDPGSGTLNAAARRAVRLGYLVPNRRRYERQKQRATLQAGIREVRSAPSSSTATGPLAPTRFRAWAGINNVDDTPPDETSAVGTGRYVELVNSDFAIYDKTSNTPIGTGTLNSLVQAPPTVDVFDPQIMWDPTTNRFYFAAAAVVSRSDNRIAFGFSKTATPNSAADWCAYNVGFGSSFPDFPKLGDSKGFTIIGANLFNSGGGFLGSHIEAISKPGGGTTCPSASTFKMGGKRLGGGGFTPTPASEIDTRGTGWAVATTLRLPSKRLLLYKVTRNGTTGAPVIGTTPTAVSVPRYKIPPSIPQKGAAFRIDSSDTRNTQAQAAVDPGHGGRFAIWTQHTVRGGAGAEVRWYEINPASHKLIQRGKATSGSLFEFNGAIAPNRRINGSRKGGGGSMTMNFNTSSTTTFPSIKMVSKLGAGAQSRQLSVFNGTRPLGGFDCVRWPRQPCRWGDYAAATPDPSKANRIWQVSQFGKGTNTKRGPATSRTWNFIAAP